MLTLIGRFHILPPWVDDQAHVPKNPLNEPPVAIPMAIL
jgi:hypothetical protein